MKRKEPEQEVAQVEVKTKALHYLARAQDPYRVKIRNESKCVYHPADDNMHFATDGTSNSVLEAYRTAYRTYEVVWTKLVY